MHCDKGMFRSSSFLLLALAAACGGAATPEVAPSPEPVVVAEMPRATALPLASPPAQESGSESPTPKPDRNGHRGFDYVTIESLRDAPAGIVSRFAGADVDAIELVKADGRRFYATAIELALDSEGRAEHALGAPSGCHGFVSLGDAGTIRVRFEADIELGDRLVVHEVDASRCGDIEQAGVQLETYAVSVGVRDVPEETRWLGDELGDEGTHTFTVAPGPT